MRATLAALLVPLLAGCPDRTIAGVSVDQGTVTDKNIPAVPRRDLDILFLIDDSLSMKEEQASLKANFGRFINVLESIEGGLPSVHIAVATPNMGTSAIDGTKAPSVGTCVGTGENGKLRRLPNGGPAFLSDLVGSGARQRNYTGTLTDAFAQIADVGTNGCGIEQHFEAIKHALDGSNPENTGFLRKDAYLAVIIVADEDDCSLAKSTLFSGNPNDATYGDTVNFRCAREGMECDTPDTDLDVVGPRRDCHPKYDSTVIAPVDRYSDFLKSLKATEGDVFVAGIVGDPGPVEVIKKGNVSVLKQSCEYTGPTGDKQFAYPGIRMFDFLDQFPTHNASASICREDLTGGLTQIATALGAELGATCFAEQLADMDPETDGAQYSCTVTDTRRVPGQPDEELAVIPTCDATKSRIPCYHIDVDAEQCKHVTTNPKLKLVIERGGVVPTTDRRVRVQCVTVPSSGQVQ
ncbi:MAG: hypothetical protein JNL83_34955 [Myxococcales bacterium]|nr:hypothetical protein [Myxococcales bacterium]